jgi:hypothetical protein
MTWFTVLKMPNPFGGKWQTLTSSEYYKMDIKDKEHYHNAMSTFYNRQLKQAVIPRKAGQAPPATDDQIRGLRELYRFHDRQLQRIRKDSEKENYYSLEEEKDRNMKKPIYDAVERMPHTTKEMYDNYTRERKIQYWQRLARKLKNEYGNIPKSNMADKIKQRMQKNPNYNPPFEGDKLTTAEYRDKYKYKDVSQYDDFTDEEKYKYHSRMRNRQYQGNVLTNNQKELARFHRRMSARIKINSSLPTYPTPEAEKEAEEK